jgi:2-polyprenyl-3-methyl-5-hydroxy-6-metoxy-1,4-benzoquinol methylase
VRLLKAELLIKTGEVDHANWNYRPFIGWIQRLRFKLAISFLNEVQCHRLLEVGYGSGIFMPELDRYCEELHGIDIHNKAKEVQKVLEQAGIKTKLYSASVESTIFPNNYFNYVVAVSALEFVHNINAACQEIRRILKPNGFLIVITPGHSKIYDMGLEILTGESAKQDYVNRRELLLPTLLENFSITQSLIFPPVICRVVPLYIGLKLCPKQT